MIQKLTKRHLHAAIDVLDTLRSAADSPIDREEIHKGGRHDPYSMAANFTVEFSASPFDLPGRVYGQVALSGDRERIWLSAGVSVHLSSGPLSVQRCHLSGQYNPETSGWVLAWTS